MSYRILVTGTREPLTPVMRRKVADALIEVTHGHFASTIVHGGCPTGVDAYVDDGARVVGWTVEVHPAEWDQHDERCYHRPSSRCPAAGPRRNRRMVELGADVVLAFPLGASKGTRGCIKLAEDAGLKVIVHDLA